MQKEKKKKRETEGERTKNKRRRKRGGFPPPRFDRIIDAPWSIQQDWTGNNGGFEHRSWLHPPPRRPLRPVFLPPSLRVKLDRGVKNEPPLPFYFFFLLFFSFAPLLPLDTRISLLCRRTSRTSVASEEGRGRAERLSMKRRERDGKGDTRSAIKPRSFARIISSRAPPPCEGTDSSSLAWIEIIHPRAFRFAFNVTKTYGSVYFADEGEGLLNNRGIDPGGFVGTRESS